MQMDMQQRGFRLVDRTTKRRLDVIDIIEPFSVVEIHDEMRTRAPHPVPHHEMVVTLLSLSR